MSASTYFDTRHEQMATVIATEGNHRLCYERQAAIVDALLRPGMTVLDVGCGATLPYRAEGAYVIGLDPSEASLARNTDVDERIVGSAMDIPCEDASVDLVVAFYSLHHVTADTMAESARMRVAAFGELSRVLRPGGRLLIFEMAPTGWAWGLQRGLWNLARRALGGRLDSLFWPDHEIVAAAVHGRRSGLWFDGSETFDCSPFALIAPVIGLPWLRIPCVLFPLTPTLYRWSKP